MSVAWIAALVAAAIAALFGWGERQRRRGIASERARQDAARVEAERRLVEVDVTAEREAEETIQAARAKTEALLEHPPSQEAALKAADEIFQRRQRGK